MPVVDYFSREMPALLVGAEGATAPETLRQRNRAEYLKLWKAARRAIRWRPPKGETRDLNQTGEREESLRYPGQRGRADG